MKKMHHFRKVSLSAATLALLALTACGSNETADTQAPAADPAPTTAENALTGGQYAGTVLLSVNPEIEMEYDKAGNVLTLTGCNDDGKAVLASVTDWEGKPCDDVIARLVEQIEKDGYFDTTVAGHEKNVILKLERGSATPDDDFLQQLAKAVEQVVADGGSRAMTIDEDDYDDVYGDKGYINASTAESLLAAQLGRSDVQFVEKEYDLDDGDYEVEFVLDGVEYEYEVNAVTGKVTEMETDVQDDHDDHDDDLDDVYDDDWYDDLDDVYDDDRYDDVDDQYDDDRYDDVDDQYDDDHDDDLDDVYDDDWDDGQDDVYDDDHDDDWDDDDDDDDNDDWDDDQDDDDDDWDD